MRCYVNGEIKLSNKIPSDLFEVGYVEKGADKCYYFIIDYEEYFVDEIENDFSTLCDYAKAHNIKLDGFMKMECDGEEGEYCFSGTDYEEFWGYDYYLHDMEDETIIEELKKRGYIVTKGV